MEHVTVYHGSTIANCESIIKGRKFYNSKSTESLYSSLVSGKNSYQWLGEGIYFWPNNSEFAMYWANLISKAKSEPSGVLKVVLKYEESKCFDLRQKAHYDVVKEIISRLVLQFEKKICVEELKKEDKYKFIGCVCDMLFQKKVFDYYLVYCDFLIEEDAIFPKMTAQICVKNDKVIEYESIHII